MAGCLHVEHAGRPPGEPRVHPVSSCNPVCRRRWFAEGAQGKCQPLGDATLASTSRLTTGATSVPSSSICRIILACGTTPDTCARKRWWPKSSCWKRILSITYCGLPIASAPRSVRPASRRLPERRSRNPADPDSHSAMPQRYPIRSSRGTRLGMNVPLPRAISRPSPSTSTPSPMINRLERLTMVPRAVMTPAEIGRRK